MILGKEKVSTGASNDIQVATTIARKMVSEWGMSPLGPIAFTEPESDVFLGYSIAKRKNMADKTALQVDTEIARLINNAYKRTQNLLRTYRKELDTLAKGLIEYETLSGEEVKLLLSGKKIGKEEKSQKPTSTKTSVPEVE
jgi:cell division protease FtsH